MINKVVIVFLISIVLIGCQSEKVVLEPIPLFERNLEQYDFENRFVPYLKEDQNGVYLFYEKNRLFFITYDYDSNLNPYRLSARVEGDTFKFVIIDDPTGETVSDLHKTKYRMFELINHKKYNTILLDYNDESAFTSIISID